MGFLGAAQQEQDHSDSHSDAELTAARATPAAECGAPDGGEGREGGTWECRMCTFLNEDAAASKCEVCESSRPDLARKTRKLTQWLSQPANKAVNTKKEAKQEASGAAEEPIEVIDSSSGDDDDDTSVTSNASFSGRTSSQLARGKSNSVNKAKAGSAMGNRGLWADVYAPKTMEELCVNKKKVQELSDWLVRNASPSSSHASVHPQKRLLFLCGPPGSGKSTAVRCIAKQLGLLVKEWEDNSSAGKLNYERMLQEQFWTPQVSNVDDFSDFIYRSSTYAALPIAVSRGSSSSSHLVHNRKRKLPSVGSQTTTTSPPGPGNAGQLILIESWPQSWSKEKSVWEEKLQHVYQHVVDPMGSCRFPVVCIYSDAQGGKIDADHLSRKFSREVMHSPFTSVININAVTTAQLKKQLVRVATHENCASEPVEIQQVIDNCNGDIRHALNMLQLSQNPEPCPKKRVASSASKKTRRKADLPSSFRAKTSSSVEETARDPFLSDFHVIGKLLHGKMKRTKSGGESEASEIDYDQILDASAMPLDRVLALVHENSVEYFSQVEDLADALELMSLCETMLADSYRGVGSSETFKRTRDVAQAILLRTIALTNANPAPTAFRPITRPRTYAIRQRLVSRREEMQLTTRGDGQGLQYACTGDVFAFEVEPFLSIMDRSGGPATRGRVGANVVTMGSLSIQEELDDDIESSDNEW
ncbi:hypothetical protein BBJ28_00000096 [Nothophytophthora sp. Chile5]|nr:hypothetical protein BBJ28_00000096 [Nothophytophthora sp. Chile5]